MAAFFKRWASPVIGVTFAAGLQLSGAVQPTIGFVLIAVAVVFSVGYVLFAQRNSQRERTSTDGNSAFIRTPGAVKATTEGTYSSADDFYNVGEGSDITSRHDVHDPRNAKKEET